MDQLTRDKRDMSFQCHLSSRRATANQQDSSVTHQDEDSERNKKWRESAVDEDGVVNVTLLNVACVTHVHVVTLFRRV